MGFNIKLFYDKNINLHFLTTASLYATLARHTRHPRMFGVHSHVDIGRELWFVHDHEQASVWLIDFAKTVILPQNHEIDHNTTWKVGNHEDGYLIGINNMLQIFTELEAEMSGDVGAMELSFASTTSSSMASTSPQHLVSESNNEYEAQAEKKEGAVAVAAAVDNKTTQAERKQD